ncbi:MAG: hypothetical protein ABIV63_15380 [Caldimonas sp.]
MHTQSLSFSIRIARTRNELQAACRVRAMSYGHHVPHLHETLMEPDLLDADEHTVVVLCVDKASGEAVGTARFQTNAGGPLLIEHSVTVPDNMRKDTRAEITRLSAVAGADPLVKLCLMKASYLFCLATQVRWMVIGARSEALVRQYRRLGFTDLFGDGRFVPLLHAGRLDHQILSFNVTGAESRWRETGHPLYDFMIETSHPDIQLFSTRPALPRREPVRRVEQPVGWPLGASRSVGIEASARTASGRPVLVN